MRRKRRERGAHQRVRQAEEEVRGEPEEEAAR
jgi:hypothetical protein